MASLRRRPNSPLAEPLEDDDLLAEILLRLPPLPSSLPRASAVSRRWRSLASDPRFCRRFRAHHRRNPPLLGCFVSTRHKNIFLPSLEAPNRIPEGRFTFPIATAEFRTLGCRHGLVLIYNRSRKQILVLDPVSGDKQRLDIPPGFLFETNYTIGGAVLRVAADVHHFQVVLVGNCEKQHTRLVALVYSSETGEWGDLTSIPLPSDDSSGLVTASVYQDTPAVMVGNSLYWFIWASSFGILEFDLERRSLALIPVPGKVTGDFRYGNFRVIPIEGGGLGFLFLLGCSAQLWKWNTNCDGIASWVLGRTIALDKLLSTHPEDSGVFIIGFAEENNVVLLWRTIGIFMVQLESLHIQKLPGSVVFSFQFYPLEGVYTADKGIDGGQDGAGLLQNI